ncbi:MAG TPA: hypothetical protein VK543_04600 [Puia sp.]|nr:hypothetical protein [Puia sp.]
MSFSQQVVYTKMALKELLKYPGPGTLVTCFRYYPQWKKMINSGGSTVTAQIPWLTFGAIDFLKKIMNSDMHVFEYGSGGSTLYWSSHAKQVVSVEHNKDWFDTMKKQFANQKITNVEYVYKEPQPDQSFSNKQFKNPDDYISSDEEVTGKNFEDYVKTIDAYPDAGFDLIIVDGRARPSCIKHSLRKLKKGGYLVVDNADREYYLGSFNFDKNSWKRWNFHGPVPFLMNFSMTTILKRLA